MIQMQRYFVDAANWLEHKVILEQDAHHIIRVMRYQVGDNIICVHPNGKVARCEIFEINETENIVVVTIAEWLETDSELPVHVTILQSLPKGSKLDLIIQKGTELGAAQFILFQSEHSVVKWDDKKRNNRLQRFEKIVKEASEQSGRTIVPQIHFTDDVVSFVETYTNSTIIKLLAYEEEAKVQREGSLFSELQKVKAGDHIIVCVGPEGGFHRDEVTFYKENGFVPVRLGKRILRTETAALYALACISYHVEEMDNL